jgi:hypothetical protein
LANKRILAACGNMLNGAGGFADDLGQV